MNFLRPPTAKIVAYSKNPVTDKCIVTFELVFPRFILAEVLTHRVFSRNTSSSRAVPSKKMGFLTESLVNPSHWGENRPGMTAGAELRGLRRVMGKFAWQSAKGLAFACHKVATLAGGHKQWVNRIIEPFIYTKQLVTTTELDNFFELRLHPAAQPEIQLLAKAMRDALDCATPEVLKRGDWHLPYMEKVDVGGGKPMYLHTGCRAASGDVDFDLYTLDEAIAVSVSSCAQISYRSVDVSMKKAMRIFNMLHIGSKTDPEHASPTEHQATPILIAPGSKLEAKKWPVGVTHLDRDLHYWSGNFKDWVQLRHNKTQLNKCVKLCKENS